MSPLQQLAEHYPGLDFAKAQLLWVIGQSEGASMAEVAEILDISPGSAQFHINTLASGKGGRTRAGLGLVQLVRRADDKRCWSLTLTDAGRAVCQLIAPLNAATSALKHSAPVTESAP